ncbi:Uncharacterized protein TCM_019031 [Theobroma cacao]|uniref:ATP-dependent DNA helicase n=1 Tax=Theobroma cacao TaxID=3641 RepID=A0A061ENE2_THECC|nr:Uncharacterized protein TCM_019031 [Theobroma cacao]
MIHRFCFEALNKSLQDLLTDNCLETENKAFSGKIMLLGGDFRQILPIVEVGTRSDIVNASINQSLLWKFCCIYKLKTNMRLLRSNFDKHTIFEISSCAQWLLDIENGNIPASNYGDEDEPCWIQIPDDLLLPSIENPIETIVSVVYNQLQEKFADLDYLKQRSIITPYNENVDLINSNVLNLIPGILKSYFSINQISKSADHSMEHEVLYLVEFLNSLNFLGIPNHQLDLKNTKFQLTANIIDVQAPNGWYYNAYNQCAAGLRFCADKFWCPVHDEKTPVLTMILGLTVEDLTGKIQLLAFGQQAEKLIGATVGELAIIKTIDKMVLPPPIKALINTRKTFKVGLTGKAIEVGLTIFKIFDSTNPIESSTRTFKMHKGTTSVNEQPTCSQPSLLTI